MTTRPLIVKICGLSTTATLDAAISAGADMVGLVHFAKSPRHVPVDGLGALSAHVSGRAKVVLLTVDAGDDLIAELVAAARPDMLQLHGRETPERVAAVRTATGLEVIKVIGVETADDLVRAASYEGVADMFLFDAKAPKDATRPGGLGTPFDWSLLSDWSARHDAARSVPFLLSGGLGPTNVEEALKRVQPTGVDVSSGVESAPGVKDATLIRAFIATVRAAQTQTSAGEKLKGRVG